MEQRKANRLAYKRNWAAATRSLSGTNTDGSNLTSVQDRDISSDTDEFCAADIGGTLDTAEYLGVEATSVAANYNRPNDQPAIHVLPETADNQNVAEWDWDNIDGHITLSSDSDADEEEHASLNEQLAAWVNRFHVKHNATDDLLKLLQLHGHPELPATTRTLLKTTRVVTTDTKSGMEYIYFGLSQELLKRINYYPSEIRDAIELLHVSLNIDGIPLFHSSSKTLWPILCQIHLQPTTVFTVAISFGESKPADLDFLADTITEMNYLIEEGLQIDGKVIDVRLKCIICDAPAKAMVKGIKLYSGYFGCDRCTQKGTWMVRITYQEIDNITLRTNESFRSQNNEEHHHVRSPFCDLPVDMVNEFPLDYMHQCCLGVMKQLLLAWMRGKKAVQLSAANIGDVSRELDRLKKFVPSCFARKPRGLHEIDRWKATEYRQFLLYTGKIALKRVLRKEYYDHFMTFSIAMSILVCPRLVEEYSEYAHELLVHFVKRFRDLYGAESLVYNVHSMLHISQDAVKHGSLDKCAAFPFENFLQQLKRLVRSGKRPVAQIVKRLSEVDQPDTVKLKHGITISAKRPNNAYALENSTFCEVIGITNEEDEAHNNKLLCRTYDRAEPLFVTPCNSRIIDVCKMHERNAHVKVLSQRHLIGKAIMIARDGCREVVFMTVLHDFY